MVTTTVTTDSGTQRRIERQRQLQSQLGAAFQQLRHTLLHQLRRQLDDPHLADDLLQEVFAKAASQIQNGKRPDNLGGWLYRISQSTVADHFRGQRMRGQGQQAFDETLHQHQQSDDSAHHELASCLDGMIATLPTIYRQAINSQRDENDSLTALAHREQLAVSTIKNRASRARRMLRDKLLACCEIELESGLVQSFTEKPEKQERSLG